MAEQTAFERIRDRLVEVTGTAGRATGRNHMFRCPAHEDRNPSLSLTAIAGQALIYCHAGCDTADVLAALGMTMADLYDDRRGYSYRYDHGRIVTRYYDRDGRKHFAQSGDRSKVELYHLSRLLNAGPGTVFLVEGEKDVHAIESLDGVATTAPQGARNFAKVDVEPLRGRYVTAIVDQDEAGQEWAAAVAAKLTGVVAGLRFARPRVGKDAADHVAAGYGLEDFEVIPPPTQDVYGPMVDRETWVQPRPDEGTSTSTGAGTTTGDDKEPRKSASTILVELAQEHYEFGVTDLGETFGVPRSGPRIVHMLRGGKVSLRKQLARLYFERAGRAAPQQALADAMLVVEGMAQETEPTELALRVAQVDGAIWIDMGDVTGRAIRVDAGGWSIHDEAPVLFRRTELTGTLPEPEPGDLGELWEWVNVSEPDRPIVLAWLLAALFPDLPHPVLNLSGEQGTGKTTTEKVLVSLIDPTPVPTRKAPRDAEAWITAAAGSWVVGLDNLSEIPDWFSDSLCRAVTGDGEVRRRLYTDGELAVFAFRRVIVMSGIDLGALRPDLAERVLPVRLDIIPDENRLEEGELWPAWRDAHPRLLGAILASLASLIRVLPSVRLATKPRMADYARILAGVDRLLGTRGMDRYLDQQKSMAAEALTGEPFITAIVEAFPHPGGYVGTAGELLHLLTTEERRRSRGWPRNARAVTVLLRRQAPAMRKAGWTVYDDGGRNHANAAEWTIIPPPREAGIRGSHTSHDSHQTIPNASHASYASQASHESPHLSYEEDPPL